MPDDSEIWTEGPSRPGAGTGVVCLGVSRAQRAQPRAKRVETLVDLELVSITGSELFNYGQTVRIRPPVIFLKYL